MEQIEDRINLERRISKAEENLVSLDRDLKDIKKTLRWLTGLVFSLNITIIGILTKGFGIL
jgi:hypothetical protein